MPANFMQLCCAAAVQLQLQSAGNMQSSDDKQVEIMAMLFQSAAWSGAG